MDLNNRLDYEACSPTEKEAKKHDGLESLQWLKDKIGRINGWAVCYSKLDPADKSVTIERMTGNREKSGTSMEHLSYEDICKLFWWKSFDIVGPDTIKPVKMTLDEKSEMHAHVNVIPQDTQVIDVNEDQIIKEVEQDYDVDMSAGLDEDVQDD